VNVVPLLRTGFFPNGRREVGSGAGLGSGLDDAGAAGAVGGADGGLIEAVA